MRLSLTTVSWIWNSELDDMLIKSGQKRSEPLVSQLGIRIRQFRKQTWRTVIARWVRKPKNSFRCYKSEGMCREYNGCNTIQTEKELKGSTKSAKMYVSSSGWKDSLMHSELSKCWCNDMRPCTEIFAWSESHSFVPLQCVPVAQFSCATTLDDKK